MPVDSRERTLPVCVRDELDDAPALTEHEAELQACGEERRALAQALFAGFALHEIDCDVRGEPADYRLLAVSPSFARLIGFSESAIVGRPVAEVLPGCERDWLAAHGPDATAAAPIFFESYLAALERHFRVALLRLAPQRLTCIFADITAEQKADSERRLLAEQLSQAQKLQAVGQLAAGIAHEINTPAQFVGDSLEFVADSIAPLTELIVKHREALAELAAGAAVAPLRDALAAAEVEADLDYLIENLPAALHDAKEGVARISRIVRAMKEFAHPDQSEMTRADINRALEATLTIARNEYKYVAEVKTDFGELPPVMCFIGELNQVFLNLLVNAAHAIGDVIANSSARGLITVRTACANDIVTIEITDTGGGIPATVRARMFEPFFTTKPVGKGSGQGLAIAHSVIIDKHGGLLDVDTELGKGSCFRIRLSVQGTPLAPLVL